MRGARTELGTRLGRGLLALYPEPWRERYGEEMEALLEDDPPGPRGLASLARGAACAHARPQPRRRAPRGGADAIRLSIGALFACWIAISLAGSAFAKVTEHYDAFEHRHPVLTGARDAITIGAALGAVSIALGGLPLVWHALLTAMRRRDRRLAAMIASPALAGGLVLGLAALLAAIAPSRQGRFPAAFVLEILVPLALAGLAWGAVAAIAPKMVMRRAQPPLRLLRRAASASQALTLAMLLVTGGLLVYLPVLWSAPETFGAAASGPFGASARVTLCLALVGALAACGPALVAARRARRARRAATAV
ncbi:MAG: hypothetical protein ACYDC2_12185 [Solirubrobacteraceae bacterium]